MKLTQSFILFGNHEPGIVTYCQKTIFKEDFIDTFSNCAYLQCLTLAKYELNEEVCILKIKDVKPSLELP